MPRLSETKIRQILSDTPEENAFYLSDGRTIRNLKDLSNTLKDMDKETWSFHVNKEKNDFYNWISQVFDDRKLANDIKRTKNIRIMQSKINRRVKQLKKIINKK